MKKKLAIITAAFAVAVGAFAFTMPTVAHNNDGDWNDRDWQSWRNDKWREYKTVQTNLTPTTAPTEVGQSYVLTEDIYDQWGNLVGKDAIVCTAMRLVDDGPEYLCQGSVTIDNKGDLQIQGMYKQGEAYFTVSIIGGDGKFKFAKGQAKVNVISDTERKVKFDLN